MCCSFFLNSIFYFFPNFFRINSFSEENGINFKSFNGFNSFCKAKTVGSTLVGANLSALFAKIKHGKPVLIM